MCLVPSIVLADGHPVILMGLTTAIGQFPQQQVVAQAHGGHELIQVLTHIDCNVIVTSYNLDGEPTSDNMQLLTRLRQQHPRCGIIVCTMVRNPTLLHVMRQIGVACIVNKNDDFVHAGHAVMTTAHGVRYDNPRILEELGLGFNDRNGFERLSTHEREVLRLYVAGTAVSDIAQMLGSSVKTVNTQRAVASRKLGLVREIGLFQYAHTSGLTVPRQAPVINLPGGTSARLAPVRWWCRMFARVLRLHPSTD